MSDLTPRFEVRPLVGWDKTKTAEPLRARFRSGWESTLDMLKREAFLLNVKVIVCQIDITDADLRRDGMIRANARPGFQGVKVSMDSKHGPLTYATDTFDFWRDNVRAVALGLEALRAVDRYGITKSGEQYRGFAAISAKPMEDGLTEADARLVFADALGKDSPLLAELNTKAGVYVAFRTAAKRYHPDVHHDDGSVFRLLMKAKTVLTENAR